MCHDADVSYALLGRSHDDRHNQSREPRCGLCINGPSLKTDWNPKRITTADVEMVNKALKEEWPIPQKKWRKIMSGLRGLLRIKDWRKDWAVDYEDPSGAFERKKAKAARVLRRIYTAAKHGKRPSKQSGAIRTRSLPHADTGPRRIDADRSEGRVA